MKNRNMAPCGPHIAAFIGEKLVPLVDRRFQFQQVPVLYPPGDERNVRLGGARTLAYLPIRAHGKLSMSERSEVDEEQEAQRTSGIKLAL